MIIPNIWENEKKKQSTNQLLESSTIGCTWVLKHFSYDVNHQPVMFHGRWFWTLFFFATRRESACLLFGQPYPGSQGSEVDERCFMVNMCRNRKMVQENHRKTIGKWWFNGFLWDLPSSKPTYIILAKTRSLVYLENSRFWLGQFQ